MDEMSKDARFARVTRDPKFRRIPKAERKVRIDKRFQAMFKDKKFTVTYTTDKRGRPIHQTTTENLRKYYDLSSSEDEDSFSQDESTSSARERTGEKVKNINTKKKEIQATKDEEKMKKTGSNFAKDSLKRIDEKKNISVDEQIDDVCLSSSKDLLKSREQYEQCSNSESDNEFLDNKDVRGKVQEGFSKLELKENEKQLYERRKNEDGMLTNEIKEKLKDLTVNYARGEGALLTDTSSEEESSEISDAEEDIEHNWGELDKEAETTDEITHRLAICNMDWDRIRAVDLMILLNSFLPSGGLIRSVVIYPSEFGQQRMKEEEISGPTELRNDEVGSEDEKNEDNNEEGAKYHMEKLRRYQLNRLRYYYAVAEFDSAETANKVYTECDGIEYESTATRLDLRFIPYDTTFDQEPKEMCKEIPEPTKYQPRQFITTALQQVKVNLTWDETNPDREEFAQKLNSGKLQDIDENVLQTYLASGSEDDSDMKNKDITERVNDSMVCEANDDPIVKYKSLLKTIEEEEESKKRKDVEMEFTWGVGAEEKVEKLIEKRAKTNEELTPFERYLEKRKAKRKAKREERKKKEDRINDSEDSVPSDVDTNDEYFAEEFKNGKISSERKKKMDDEDNCTNSSIDKEDDTQRKAELELLLMDRDENGKKHFNMKEIEENATMTKSKRKRLSKKNLRGKVKEIDDFEVNVKDQRFTALFTSHHFNIDPADPHYKKTKGMEALISEKLKRRANNDAHSKDDKQPKKIKMDSELSAELQTLVKSVKRKTQDITQSIKS